MTGEATRILVRPATPEDATGAALVLRNSITHLCVEDHQNDTATLEQWLRNKTTEQFCAWLLQPDRLVVIAEAASVPCGVGAIHVHGEVRLCYVSPAQQRLGVGRALLAALEAQARHWGLNEIRLVSTAGARAFYEARGYTPAGEPVPGFGVSRGYPYRKVLTGDAA